MSADNGYNTATRIKYSILLKGIKPENRRLVSYVLFLVMMVSTELNDSAG